MATYLTVFLGGVIAELFTDVKDTSAMAYGVTDSDGVCFVPSFSGLQVLAYVQFVKMAFPCLFHLRLPKSNQVFILSNIDNNNCNNINTCRCWIISMF